MNRTNTVQQLLENEQERIPQQEIFKTRTKIIDDRNISSPTNSLGEYKIPGVDDFLSSLNRSSPAKSQKNQALSPLKKSKVAWNPSDNQMLVKELNVLSAFPLQEYTEGLEEMLRSSSEVFLLPEIEAKYLEQYSIDSVKLNNLCTKVDLLSRKMKEVRLFIKERILEEQAALIPYVVKIQAWYRGIRSRKQLGISNKQKRPLIDLKTVQAAVKIQSCWKSYVSKKQEKTRQEIESLQQKVKQCQDIMEKYASEKLDLKTELERQHQEILVLQSENKSYAIEMSQLREIYKLSQLEIVKFRVLDFLIKDLTISYQKEFEKTIQSLKDQLNKKES